MNSIITHTLSLLADVGLSIHYPEFRHVTREDQHWKMHFHFTAIMGRPRVSIEENTPLKLMLVFTALDFYIDTLHPQLEGESYKRKYEGLPAGNDYELMFRELFRLAKLIRNALVHNAGAVSSAGGGLEIEYTRSRPHQRFALRLTAESLITLQTAIFMYVKGDLGRGSYFLGIMRSLYAHILQGIDHAHFKDEFAQPLAQPSGSLELRTRVREIYLNPQYAIHDGVVKVSVPDRTQQEWEGWDFYIQHQGAEYLVPQEALDAQYCMAESVLISDWQKQGSMPAIIIP